MSELTLYLKPFDVDDPTADSDILDDESEAEDNRGDTIAKAGEFTGADSATGVLALLFEEEESAVKKTATAEFQTTMQPGDNFRVVASIDKDHFEVMANDDKKLKGSSNEDRQRIVDASIEASPKDAEIISPENYASPVLTVWRYVHIEVDSMGAVEENYIAGNITSVIDDVAPNKSWAITDVDFTEENDDGRFWNGRLMVNGGSFDIKESFHSPAGKLLLEVDNTDHLGSDKKPSIGEFTAFDDDDFDDNDGLKIGDEGDEIPRPDMSMAESSDDQNCLDGSCNIFAAAYVMPLYDIGDNNPSVQFMRNVVNDPEENSYKKGVRKMFDFDQSVTKDSDVFWTVYILGAYQDSFSYACDYTSFDANGDQYEEPDACSAGVVDDFGGHGALVFFEGTRELAISYPTFGITPAMVAVHEIGHVFNGQHTDLGVMGSITKLKAAKIYSQPLFFASETLRRIRAFSRDKSGARK